MIPIWPFNNCFLAHVLVNGVHCNLYGRGHPTRSLLNEKCGKNKVVIVSWWRISEFRYRPLRNDNKKTKEKEKRNADAS